MEIMDSSMILVHELLGYGLLGFYLDINLVPLSRVLFLTCLGYFVSII